MYHLQLQKYTKEEILDITGIKNDSHAARAIKNTLSKWGYSYEYKSKEITITRQPTTPLEKLQEILVRELDLDIQTDIYAFALFFNRFSWDESFCSMPWEERVKQLNIDIDKRTLQRWCKKLIDAGVIVKDTDSKVEWFTIGKTRFPAEEMGEDFVKEYKAARYKKIQGYLGEGLTFAQAYKNTFAEMYKETRSILYSCSTIAFTSFGSKLSKEDIEEINNLCEQLSDDEPFEAVEKVDIKIEKKGDLEEESLSQKKTIVPLLLLLYIM